MSLSEKALRLVQDEMQSLQRQSTSASSVVSTDVGIRAHNAAVAHIEQCMEMVDYEGEGDAPDVATMAPFCGCIDCIVREVLFVAYPILTGKDYDEPTDDHVDG